MDTSLSFTNLIKALAASAKEVVVSTDDRPFEVKMTDLAEETENMAGYAGGHDVPTAAMYASAEMVRLIPQLFDKIKHGEPGHEAWLKEAIECHFLGKPMPEYVAK